MTEQENKARNEPEAEKPKAKEPRKELTEAQRQRRNKMIVFPLLFALFAGSMWLIFAPSEQEKEQAQQGFNTDVPDPTHQQLEGDKQSAYEQEQFNRKAKERQTQMQDLAALFGSSVDEEKEALYLEEPSPQSTRSYSGSGGGSSRPRESINASAHAYKDINRTLGNFYETPKEDPEKEELRLKLEELTERLEQAESPRNTMDEQLALMEKSYELAAKYMPQGQNQGQPAMGQPTATTTESNPTDAYKNGKAMINSVGQVHSSVVSGLSQPISDSEFMENYSQPRNYSFNTAVGTEGETEKNTIKACIHENQTITDGQAVRMRLLEPMRAGDRVIPRNALVTGMGRIQGERLGIKIGSLEYEGTIIPVELEVFDTDGQSGIFIPGSMELNAVKEVAANLGSSLGTSISITNQSAGDQLLAELGKGAIQGTSQYISKKMRVVKVSLKAGYNVLLYQNIQ